jgi:hypothetical protein
MEDLSFFKAMESVSFKALAINLNEEEFKTRILPHFLIKLKGL